MRSFADRCRRLNEERGHLCVGIDPRPGRFPPDYEEAEGLDRWCVDLIEATSDHAAAYKPNLAFFLEMGPDGITALEAATATASKTGALVILDAKFGDIGSTAEAYARFADEVVGADAVTLNPYLGTEAIAPFLQRGLDAFVLARTTNPGADKLQEPIARKVIELFAPHGVGFVAPGTHPERLAEVRRLAPDAPLLIPGIGAQGGTPEAAVAAASGGPFLVNASRGIAHAPGEFPASAAEAAKGLAERLDEALGQG